MEREKAFGVTLKPEWYEGFIRLVKSAEDLNITDKINRIKAPTLIIGAEYDATTPIQSQEILQREIENSKFIMIKDSGHASMYEKPYEFATAVLGFIGIYNKELKIL